MSLFSIILSFSKILRKPLIITCTVAASKQFCINFKRVFLFEFEMAYFNLYGKEILSNKEQVALHSKFRIDLLMYTR